MNIPETLTKMIGSSDALSSIASRVGLGQGEANKAVSAAVPALLAGFSQIASTKQGAEQLAEAAGRSDSSLLENLGTAFSTRGDRVAEQGSGLLNSLFSGSGLSMLPSILSRFSGVGEGVMGKLLGMLTPVVLGFLGKQNGGGGAAGLANLLSGQKDYIKGAMPTGLFSSLSSAIPGIGNFFGGAAGQAGDMVRSAAATAGSAYQSAVDTGRDAVHTTTSSARRWLVPAAVALALLAVVLLWSRRNRVTTAEIETPRPAPATVSRNSAPEAVGAPSRAASGIAASGDFVTETSKLITEATATISNVASGGSPEASIPKLKEINEKLAGLKSTWNALPESARASAQQALAPMVSKLESTVQPVTALPAIGDSLRPHIDELLRNLRSLTGQPAKPSTF
jgi:hypothetical protein